MTPEQWAHQHVSPPVFTACGHARHSHPDVTASTRDAREGEGVCLDCGHRWQEYDCYLSDDVYDTLVAYMAFRLDTK